MHWITSSSQNSVGRRSSLRSPPLQMLLHFLSEAEESFPFLRMIPSQEVRHIQEMSLFLSQESLPSPAFLSIHEVR